jgi:hypothetical protein
MPRQDIEYMDHSFPLLEIRQSLLEVWTAGSRTPIPIHIQRYTTLTHGGLTQYNHSFILILNYYMFPLLNILFYTHVLK